MNLFIHNTRTGEDMPAVDWPTAMMWLHSQPKAAARFMCILNKADPVVGRIAKLTVSESGEFIPFEWMRGVSLPVFTKKPVVERLWNGDTEC